jgi:two-component system cell cycle response regulator DivK
VPIGLADSQPENSRCEGRRSYPRRGRGRGGTGHSGQGGNMTKRILVVEDQADNLQILRDLLTSAGYDMLDAEDGEEGVRAAKAHRPNLILMDIQLPVLDGYEATRRIKADPALRAIPIIVVTSYALGGDENKARAAGCDDYVPKPYSPRQLLAKIREYLPVELTE